MKRLLAVALACVLCACLTGCGFFETGKYMKAVCTQMVDAIITGDADGAYALMCETTPRDEFDKAFSRLHEDIGGVGEYRLRFRELNKTSYAGDGYTTVFAVYRLRCDAGVFDIELEDNSSSEKLENIRIIQVR